VLAVPRDRALEPFAQRRARLEAEEVAGASGVEAPARLAVRHRRIPFDLACEARELCDLFRKLANRDLDAGAEVHRLCTVVLLRGQHQPFDAVIHVEELARR